MRLLTFLVGIQLAQQLCCHALSALLAALMDGVFDSFPFSFRLLSRRLLCIDHRMNPLRFRFGLLLRKEVIQPHLPIRLPCYDFTPVIGLALGGWLPKVTAPTLGTPNSHGVTGGVYKARERIHRGMLIRDY